jgi:hypothetical protein
LEQLRLIDEPHQQLHADVKRRKEKKRKEEKKTKKIDSN